MILYSPCSSETAVLTFSISTSLDASTVTPGMTAPDVSFTTPAIPVGNVCANRFVGMNSDANNATTGKQTFLIRLMRRASDASKSSTNAERRLVVRNSPGH